MPVIFDEVSGEVVPGEAPRRGASDESESQARSARTAADLNELVRAEVRRREQRQQRLCAD